MANKHLSTVGTLAAIVAVIVSIGDCGRVLCFSGGGEWWRANELGIIGVPAALLVIAAECWYLAAKLNQPLATQAPPRCE